MSNSLVSLAIKIFAALPEEGFKKSLREAFYGEVVTERIIEYPLVFSSLGYQGKKESRRVLDVGCYYSNLPIQLASMGFKVVGVDLQEYQLTHPNFKFKKGDIRTFTFPDKFDIVTAISTVEHIGLGYYLDSKGEQGDCEAVAAMRKLLKPKGLLVISVPFGKPAETESYRSYDRLAIDKLLSGFMIEQVYYFGSKGKKWLPIGELGALRVSNENTVAGVGFFVARKK